LLSEKIVAERIAEGGVEKTDQKIFEDYLEKLDLKEKNLRDKTILDLGCFDGVFIRTCLDRNLTQEAYGMDRELRGEAEDETYEDNFYKADFHKGIPIQNVDLVILRKTLHLLLQEESNLESTVETLAKILDVLSPSGEIRIAPSVRTLLGKYTDNQGKFNRAMERLAEIKNIKYEFVPVGVRALERIDIGNAEKRVVMLDSVLVIKNNTEAE